MHGDAMNAFKTIGTQKGTILKLEAEIIQMRKDFENFKNEHASLKQEMVATTSKEMVSTTSKESPTIDVPKSSNEDSNACLACPRLQLEIVSLKSKIEQVTNVLMNFANRFAKPSSFKKPSKRRFKKNNRKCKIHEHKVKCNYCREIGHTTPNCHVMKNLVPKGIMKWIPKLSTCVTNPKDPTCVWDLNLVGMPCNFANKVVFG